MMTNTILQIVLRDTTGHAADSLKTVITQISDALVHNPDELFNELLKEFIAFGLKVLAALLIYLVGAWLIRRVKSLMNSMFEKKGTEKTIATFAKSLVSITLTIFLIIITIGTLGINTTSIAALLAAGGMAIGMALSGTVQNFSGGILILVFKPFKAGDYIKVQGYEGTVIEVNIANTKLKCFDNSIVILPNGALFNGNIDNFSERPQHRCKWEIDVAYGSDPDKTREVLLSIARSFPGVLMDTEGVPNPAVNLTELKDSSVLFALTAWVNTEDYWTVLHGVREEIYKQLPKNGIQFPFPQLDVHINQS